MVASSIQAGQHAKQVKGCRGRPKKTREQCVKCYIGKYSMQMWSRLIGTSGVVVGLTVQPLQAWKKGRYKLFD